MFIICIELLEIFVKQNSCRNLTKIQVYLTYMLPNKLQSVLQYFREIAINERVTNICFVALAMALILQHQYAIARLLDI